MTTSQNLTISSANAVDDGSYVSSITQVNGAVQASGTVVFAVNPEDADTVTLNGVEITFVEENATGNEVFIGATLADTLVSLKTLLDATEEANLLVATYAVDEDTLTVTYKAYSTGGNAYTTVASVATPSGATLAGGVNGTGSIVYTTNLLAGDTVTIDGVVFTIVASGATGNQINVGGTLTLTLDNIVTALNASTNVKVALATYSKVSTTTLKVTYDNSVKNGSDFPISSLTQGSTGARKVLVVGLDANWNRVQDLVTLDGQSAVALTNVKLHPYVASITSAGSGNTNAGIIYIGYGTVTTGVPASIVLAIGTHGMNQSRYGMMPVPEGYMAYPVQPIHFHSNGSAPATLWAQYKPYGSVWLGGVGADVSTTVTEKTVPITTPHFPARTLIRMVGQAGSGTPICSGEVSLAFIKK
jgi:hypothetical protein